MTDKWDHQPKLIEGLRQSIRRGNRAIVAVGPTGCGKTRIMSQIAIDALNKHKKVLLITNRRLLLDQASQAFEDRGIDHGRIQAGYARSFDDNVKIASIPTIREWIVRRNEELPDADVVLVDESHNNVNGTAKDIIKRYLNTKSVVVGFTATPVGMGHLYDDLVESAGYSELIEKGVLVPCEVYAPSEIDMTGVKMSAGEYTATGTFQRIQECKIWGDVIEHWERLNPFREPTVLFAPGVKESRWFMEELQRSGIPSAHIDGSTPTDERQDIFRDLRTGEIKIVCSCGVLREGWNEPIVSHAILLQVCRKLSNYLQIAGRVLRSFEGKSHAVLQDHTGAWYRHGPPDDDREWTLEKSDSDYRKERTTQIKERKASEGICCPECDHTRKAGPKCPKCGHEHKMSVRKIKTANGELVKKRGAVVKGKGTESSAEVRKMIGFLFGAGKSGQTVEQALLRYQKTYRKRPPREVLFGGRTIQLPTLGSGDVLLRVRVRDEFPQFSSVQGR